MTKLFSALALVAIGSVLTITSSLEARTWTSSQGQYEIEADFVEYLDGQVTLRKSDGTLVSVALTKLSPADQKYVQQLTSNPSESTEGLDGLLMAANGLLRDGRIADANAKITEAATRASSAAERQRVDAAHDLAGHLTRFWSAVVEGGNGLAGGTEMKVGKAPVVVVEASSNRLVLRALGRNCRFALDRPETIPSSLALVLAQRRLAPSDPAFPAYLALKPEDDNQKLWELAAGGPLTTEPLLNPTNNPPNNTTYNPTTTGVPNVSVTPQPPFSTPPSTIPPSNPPSFGTPQERGPVPDADVIAKHRKEIRQLLADDFKATTPKEKHDLAKKLFQLAQQTIADDSAAAYVLYIESAELAADVGDAKGATQILDQVNKSFEDDSLASREAALLATAVRVTDPPLSPQTLQLIGERALELINTAIEAEDFAAADSAADTGVMVARRLRDRKAQVQFQDLQKNISSKRKAFAAIAAAREAVAENPSDSQANRTLAVYHCVSRDNWEKGLTYLARIADQEIAQAAQQDKQEPADHVARYDLAELWWSLGEKDSSEFGDALKRRAAHWYEQAVPGLAALQKVKAQKRIDEAKQLAAAGTVAGEESKSVFLTLLPSIGSEGVQLKNGELHVAVNINGRSFVNGIWAQPQRGMAARIGYALNKEYSTLTGVAGMDDGMTSLTASSSVAFSIYSEKGKQLWSSAPMTRRGTGQAFKINVGGVETLYLVTQLSGSSNTSCYAVWGDLTLTK